MKRTAAVRLVDSYVKDYVARYPERQTFSPKELAAFLDEECCPDHDDEYRAFALAMGARCEQGCTDIQECWAVMELAIAQALDEAGYQIAKRRKET